MTEPKPSIDRFVEAIEGQIEYFSREYDLQVSAVLGALEMIKYDLMREQEDDEAEAV